MDDKEKGASALGEQATPKEYVSDGSIAQPEAENQEPATKKDNKPHKNKRYRGSAGHEYLGIEQKVYSLALKFYIEQLPDGEQAMIQAILETDPKLVQILAIKHYRDEVTDGIWAVAKVKPHWHVILRMVGKRARMRIRTILDGLHIHYRPGKDEELWMNHGVESVGNFAGYALYLTHETEEAIRDGKELYRVDEIISNLSPDEVEQIRAGYIRVSSNRKLSMEELVALDKEAFDMGYGLRNFDSWYDAQTFMVRSSTRMRTIRESYNRGVDTKIREHTEMVRLCVFIHGDHNTGKSYAATHAFTDRGMEVLPIGGGGSGKFDNLRPDHDVIVIDDDVCKNLLNMSDNYICRAYRRNKNNPVWSGHYLVVTSNLTFPEWLEACGEKVHKDNPVAGDYMTKHYYALRSRFYVCHVETDEHGISHLVCDSPSRRGSIPDQNTRKTMFMDFQRDFDKIISSYKPSGSRVTYDDIVGKVREYAGGIHYDPATDTCTTYFDKLEQSKGENNNGVVEVLDEAKKEGA